MLKQFCDMCNQPINDDLFQKFVIPVRGTGANVIVQFEDDITLCDFHVHQDCVFESIRKAQERTKTVAQEKIR